MANIFVILFLLLVMAVWSHYGMFSAFLHLVVTVAAGAIALGLWEPLVYGFLLHRMPEYAWCVGLLGPFVLLIFLLRVGLDKLAPSNMDFDQITNVVGGAGFGLLAGIITAGLTIAGLGFLPLDASLAGYRPLVIDQQGVLGENPDGGQLWIPVDRYVARFYERLAGGSFYTSTPLNLYAPRLDRQHVLYRMRVDPHASISALPESLELGQYFVHAMPLTNLPQESMKPVLERSSPEGPGKLVLIEMVINFSVPPYDTDNRLRLPPTQVRLVTDRTSDRHRSQANVYAPAALVFVDAKGVRSFIPIDGPAVSADSALRSQTIGWIFIIPEAERAGFLMLRHVRLAVAPEDEAVSDERLVLNSLGKLRPKSAAKEPSDGAAPGQPRFGPRKGLKVGSQPSDPQITAKLPHAIHTGKATRLNYRDKKILSGSQEVLRPKSRMTRPNKVDSIYVTPDQASLRIQLSREQVNSIFGQARALAAQVGGIFLTDNTNQTYAASGYVLVTRGNTQYIYFKPEQPIRAANQLPIGRMQPNDRLYLYFIVPKGINIVSVRIGKPRWNLNPPLEVR